MDSHPARLVERACREYGQDEVADWCIVLLRGEQTAGSSEFDIALLGGTTGWPPYWARVLGCRGLLYAWDDRAAETVIAALTDQHWRVREMAAKVCYWRELGQRSEALAQLRADLTERVRLAAVRALGKVGETEHAELLLELVPGSPAAEAAVNGALEELEERLDRRFTP